jgi:hypothetical protein
MIAVSEQEINNNYYLSTSGQACCVLKSHCCMNCNLPEIKKCTITYIQRTAMYIILMNETVESIHKLDLNQGCTNPEHQVDRANTLCTLTPNICGSSLWNLLHVTPLGPVILRWFLDFLNIPAPLIRTTTIRK